MNYSNNDWRLYQKKTDDAYLAHYGVKGMKWKKHKAKFNTKDSETAYNRLTKESGLYKAAGEHNYSKELKNAANRIHTTNTGNSKTKAGLALRQAQSLRVRNKAWMDKGNNRQSEAGRNSSKENARLRSYYGKNKVSTIKRKNAKSISKGKSIVARLF